MKLHQDSEIRAIIADAERRFSVERQAILGKTKRTGVIGARFFVYQALRDLGLSYEDIGLICNRDYTTIRHGLKRARTLGISWSCLMEQDDAD